MKHEDCILRAIKVAKEAEKAGEPAIGAIIVKDGEIIAEGMSSVWPLKDPSGHSESNCIRAVCKKLNTLDLHDCVMYSTLEPCGMCLSCAVWANLEAVYFGAYSEDVKGNNYEIKNWQAEEAAKNTRLSDGVSLQVQGGILRDECKQLLAGYKNWSKL